MEDNNIALFTRAGTGMVENEARDHEKRNEVATEEEVSGADDNRTEQA